MPVLQSLIADRWLGAAKPRRARQRHRRPRDPPHACRGDRLRRGAALRPQDRRAGADGDGLPAARGAPEGARRVPERAQGSSSTRSRATPARRAATAGSTSRAAPARCTPTPAMGGNELPSGNVVHEGPADRRSARRAASPAPTSWCRAAASRCTSTPSTSRSGACSRSSRRASSPAMPCIAKPATATSYLTEAMVRMMIESGLLPQGSLQLVIGATGDLLDRLDGQDVVTFTGSADTARSCARNRNLLAQLDPVQCRGRFAQRRDPRARRHAGRRGVRPVRQGSGARDDGQGRPEVHRDPARHRAAPAPRRRGRDACASGSPRSSSATRRSRACAWARWPRRRSRPTSPSASEMLDARQRAGLRRAATASRRSARASANGAFFAPTLLLCRDGMTNDAVHDVEAFGPVSTLMPYDDIDEALALAARGRGSLVATLVTHDPKVAAQGGAAVAAVARPPAHPRPRGGGRIDRPRLAAAAAQARRPGPRRRRRGAGRHPRRQALPAARRGAGLADDARRP